MFLCVYESIFEDDKKKLSSQKQRGAINLYCFGIITAVDPFASGASVDLETSCVASVDLETSWEAF